MEGARTRRIRLAWFAAVAFVAVFGIGEFASWLLVGVRGDGWWALDLQLVLDAGARLTAGQPLYADPKFLYPPLAAVIAAPLGSVDPTVVSLGYLALKVALLLISVAVLTTGWRPIDRGLVLAGLMLSLPFLHDVMLGNANAILTAAAALAVFGPRSPRSGVALGIAAAVFAKPLLAPLVLWLLVYRRPALLGMIAGGLGATLSGVLLAGPGAYLEWPRALAGGGRFAAPFAGNHGITALAPDLWAPVAAAVAVGLVVVLWRRGEGVGLAWASTAGILIAPYAGTYSALPIALAMPFIGRTSWPTALAITVLSPVATGHALPVYAAAILAVSLLLRGDGRPLQATHLRPQAGAPG